MASLRRLNEALAENAHAPVEERWVVHPFGVVGLFCTLIASVVAGQYDVSVVSAAGAVYLSWDGWKRYRRWLP